ncbi:hypothetical protein T12_13045 [Trichinella patagoniensis]|uniref:Uncharacterized protein n=1 Tax=Trichinella patagoniensis TaxID=990121 RepID=A0A0V0ZA22_9BILA|nr:hypothetical protein T12_13045 [Trichinella patagoniensis]
MDFTEKLEDFFCASGPEGVDGEANRVMIPRPPPMRRSDQSAICPAGGGTRTQCRRAIGAVRVRRR